MTCTLCPRACEADRTKTLGFCGIGDSVKIAKIMLHRWEEPCICYGKGSGAVFFSGCQLKCVFCQNHLISCDGMGKEITDGALVSYFLQLQEFGACNINLVSPTPHLHRVIPALRQAKKDGLTIPIVWNSGGYETRETVRALDGLVDVYMPDYKFFTEEEGKALASAKDYSKRAMDAISEMVLQAGKPLWDGDRLIKGAIVRHLVLPGHTKSSEEILNTLHRAFGSDGIVLSLMRQYTPMHKAKEIIDLSRRVTTLEYSRVLRRAEELGFSYVFSQEKESASEDYVPDFTLFSEDFH